MRISHMHVLLQGLLDLIMGSTIVKCAVADLGIQWAGWAVAAAFKTEKFYDLAGNSSRFCCVLHMGYHELVLCCRFNFNPFNTLILEKWKQRQFINPLYDKMLNYELVCHCYKMRIM